MADDKETFRQLVEAVYNAPDHTEAEVLWAWRDRARALLDPLRSYGLWEARSRQSHIDADTVDRKVVHDLWDLYALSRLSDILILPYQEGEHDSLTWPGPAISQDQRVAFFMALGMQRALQPTFHPFYHEIVTVEQAPDPSMPITVIEEVWPGFMLESLMFCRAGVRVRGGTDHIVKEIAETSTMYWTYRRRNRPCQDQSHGWGSNSQWRTKFRRDYTDGDSYVYNADERLDARMPDPGQGPNPAPEDLSPDERVELLVNRCFVRTRMPHNDLYPYDDTLTTTGALRRDDV